MKNYETVFVITPVLNDQQMKETASKFKDFLSKNKAEIINEENWGLKNLAYPIQGKKTGFYNLIEFKSNPDLIKKLETEYGRDEKIIRYLTVALDKHAIAYNKRRQNGELKGQQKAKKEKKEVA